MFKNNGYIDVYFCTFTFSSVRKVSRTDSECNMDGILLGTYICSSFLFVSVIKLNLTGG